MKRELTEKELSEPEEISLRDLWRVLMDQREWLFGIPIVCMFLATVGVVLAKPKWEATAVIQIGQVGQPVGQGSQLIEPTGRAIERMKMKSFEDDVVAAFKTPVGPGDPIAQLFRSSLSLKALGTTDLIQVRVRGYSRDQAAIWVQAVVDNLKAVHETLTQPTIDRLTKQLVELKKQMQMIEEERANLSRIVSNSTAASRESRFSENLLLSNLLLEKHAELRDFEMRGLAVNEQLTWLRAYPTSLVNRVYVPEMPASPKKLLIVLLAAIAGLILGAIVAFSRSYWRSVGDRA